jgi:DNA topoisomerase II
MSSANIDKAEQEGLLKFFKCTNSLSTTNMICFDPNGKLKKYSTAEEIIEDFFPLRLSYYQKRKVGLFVQTFNRD